MARTTHTAQTGSAWPRWAWALLPLLLVLLGAGVAFRPGLVLEASQPVADAPVMPLSDGRAMGQSFLALNGGLSAVDIFLQPEQPGSGTLTLRLRAGAHDQQVLAQAELDAARVVGPDFYRFAFPALADSSKRDYFFELSYQGSGIIAVGSAQPTTYHQGAQYRDGEPVEAQTSFRLGYDRPTSAASFLPEAAGWLWQLGLFLLIALLPGWALLGLLVPRFATASVAERVALALGVGLAFYPLLLLATGLLGLRLGEWHVWLALLASLAVLAWRLRRGLPRFQRTPEAFWPNLALALVLVLVVLVRLTTARPFEAPLWGDSVQHSVMAQLFLDNGGLFQSWQPYAPYATLTVQYGFAAYVALLSWLGGMGALAATVFVGQLLNACAALTLYPLAVRMSGGNRWAGVVAVLVAGLLSPMPAFYLNWGRYAQLAGQVILPVAVWLLWEALEAHERWPGVVALAGFTLVGMALAYYRMPFYYAAFVPGFLLLWAFPRYGLRWREWVGAGLRLGLIGALAVLLLIPWALRVRGGVLDETAAAGMVRTSVWQAVVNDYQSWRAMNDYVPYWLAALCLLAFGWALATRRWLVAVAGLWALVLSLLVAGQLLRLPGASLMQSFAVLIALYIPASLLVGGLAGPGLGWLAARWKYGPALALVLALLGAGLGIRPQQQVANQLYEYVTRPDTRAMAWIRQNTPENARFLVEGYSIWSGTSIVGSDAGWWIPLLAGRANTMPPQYALLNERPEDGNSARMIGILNQVAINGIATPNVLRVLCSEQITHVYVGQLQGRVGFASNQLFSPDELAASSAFRQVYRDDRVSIYTLEPQACSAQ